MKLFHPGPTCIVRFRYAAFTLLPSLRIQRSIKIGDAVYLYLRADHYMLPIYNFLYKIKD